MHFISPLPAAGLGVEGGGISLPVEAPAAWDSSPFEPFGPGVSSFLASCCHRPGVLPPP